MADRGSPGESERTRSSVSSIPKFDQLLEDGDDDANHLTAGVSHEGGASLGAKDQATEVQHLAEQLEHSKLDESDLKDLNADTTAFPEAIDQAETESGYPYSGQPSSCPSMPTRPGFLSNDPNAQGNPLRTVKYVLDRISGTANTCCLDLRMKPQGLYAFALNAISHRRDTDPTQDQFKSDVAEAFGCRQDIIHVVQRKRQPCVPLYIIGADMQNLHLIVDQPDHGMTSCLVTDHGTSLAAMLNMYQQWLGAKHGGHTSPKISLLRNGGRLDQGAEFQDFDEVDLVRAETLTLKFLQRVNQRTAKIYFVECEDTDYVKEVKEKFLQAFCEEENVENAIGATYNMWLTYGEQIMPDDEMLRTLWTQSNVDEFSMDSLAVDLASNDTFHVHFQPPDAVLVKLNFKSDTKRYMKSESVILLSPRSSVAEMRNEIAKAINKEPHSFKIFISGKKIEMDTVLEPFLRSPNCIVVVEQRPKIQLSVVDVAANGSFGGFSVSLHRYEGVERLKQEVCRQLEVPPYCVDLQHNTSPLQEQNDLRASRLRHGDTVNALLLPNRIRLSVRLASNQWEDVVVDDVTVSTVEQLKGYVEFILLKRSLEQQNRRQSTPGLEETTHATTQQKTFVTSVIVKGILLPDCSTLREAGVEMNCRVVVIQEEKLCYTVDPPGRVPLFLGSGRDNYQPPQRVMAMCDGKKFYFTSSPDSSTDAPMLYQAAPRYTGMGPCSKQLHAQFPHRQQNVACPPLVSGKLYVCHMCKSESMPNLPSTPLQGHEISRSQSDTFQNRGIPMNETVRMDASGESLQSPKHSTPIEDRHGRDGQALDSCDGPSFNESAQRATSAAACYSDSAISTPNRNHGSVSSSRSLAGQGHRDRSHLSLSIGTQSGFASGQMDPQPWPQRCRTHPPVALQPTSLRHDTSNTSISMQTPNTAGSENQCLQTPFDWTTNRPGCPSGYQSESGTFPRHRNGADSCPSLSLRPHANSNTRAPNTAGIRTPDAANIRAPGTAGNGARNTVGFWPPDAANTGPPHTTCNRNLQMVPSNLTNRTRHPSDCCSESGASHRSSRSMCSAYHYQYSVEEDPDGNLIANRQFSAKETISPEMAKIMRAPTTSDYFPCSPFPNPSALLPLQGPGALSEMSSLPQPDTTFTYIKKDIVRFLARNLGREGPAVMSQLLPDATIIEAEQRYPGDMCLRYYSCLTKWCQVKGSTATVRELVTVLRDNDRTDLAEKVEVMDVREQGYETAP
ncbi:uncharacterized protein [Littorina saxatilis]|uniref:uncharacterized protein n=1 Tax=Littorina saxatilis TaxID=31220 RepID=UPI0038B6B0F3